MTMPTIFDVNAQSEEVEPFVPTADDYVVADGFCCECGGGLDEDGECSFCEHGVDDDLERDVTMYDEYEGPFGLWGGEQFGDSIDMYDF